MCTARATTMMSSTCMRTRTMGPLRQDGGVPRYLFVEVDAAQLGEPSPHAGRDRAAVGGGELDERPFLAFLSAVSISLLR